MFRKRTKFARRRLQIALMGASLGLFATTAVAQESGGLGDNIGQSISNAIGNQIRGNVTGQGAVNPVDRGVGEALRGVVEGQNVGDAVQRGLGESVQTLGESPNQTRQRDWIESGGQGYAPGTFNQNYDGRIIQGQNPINPGFYGTNQAQVVTRIGVDGQPYQVRINSDQRARLGISMRENQQGIVVTNVTRGSAAAAAGLRPGDVLVNVDGQRVVNTQQVAQAVGQRNPGEQISLVVLRGGERQQLSAQLQGTAIGGAETQRMARPVLEDKGGYQQMQQQLQELQMQVRELQNQLRTIQQGGAASGGAEANTEAGAAANGETTLQLDAADGVDADAQSEVDADVQGALDVEADGVIDADAEVEGSTEVDVSDDSPRTGLSGRAATTNPATTEN